MFCKKCGTELSGDEKFCGVCGEPCNNVVSSQAVVLKPKTHISRKHIIIIVVVVSIVLASILHGYFNSQSYLEHKLTNNVWYSEPSRAWFDNEPEDWQVSFVYVFYADGDGYSERHANLGWNDWIYDENNDFQWELLGDKTLHLRGDIFDGYYLDEHLEYGRDWYFKGNKLVIIFDKCTLTFYRTNKWGYPTKSD